MRNEWNEDTPCAIFHVEQEGDCYVERRCPCCGRWLALKAIGISFSPEGYTKTHAVCGHCGAVKPNLLGWF